MTVLGLNAYAHDAGVALVQDGQPVFVVEEERLNRERKTNAFPLQGIRYLRERRGFQLRDIDAVAFPWRGGRFLRTVGKEIVRRLPSALNLLRHAASPNMSVGTALRFRRAGVDLARAFGSDTPVRVRFVGHHDAHATAAFFLSPFDRAAVLVMDGYGDDGSTSIYHGTGEAVRRISTNEFFDSAGIVYSMITKYLGFRTILDEGKVMALAAYGTDELRDEFAKLVRMLPNGKYAIDERLFTYHRYGELRPVSRAFERRFGPPRLPDEPITQRHMDVARGLQHTLEETVLHVARHLRRALGEPDLCFAGGTALNCLANLRLARESGFQRIFVPPNPNDAGVALGAALFVTAEADRSFRRETAPCTPFLGPSYGYQEIGNALDGTQFRQHEPGDIAAVVARELARGRLVAWFQGRAEMGPRALGNRSILADPRSPFVREVLDRRVKRREYFRPYAPSVLAERADEFFDGPSSPYMSFAATVKATRRHEIPAVLSRDGTARIQTVTKEDNPLYHRLIERFARLTGVPMILNTSFNSVEPTVCAPADAVRTFADTGVDMLVIGEHVVTKPSAVSAGRVDDTQAAEGAADACSSRSAARLG